MFANANSANSPLAISLTASEDLVWRLETHKKLEKHDGCVNTLSFNAGGDILVSGSDDLRVILWDWETGRDKLSFRSGHDNNVFQANFMPFSDDRTIITCAADGEIRQAQILEGGEVKTILLGQHEDSQVHKLAIKPGREPSYILFLWRGWSGSTFGGMDEFARLYDIRMYKWDGSSDFGQPAHYFCPQHLIGNKDTGITGLSFSDQSELLVLYGDEFIYLFTQSMGLRNPPFPSSSYTVSMGSDTSELESGSIEASSSSLDLDGRNAPQVYTGHRNCETVKGVSFFGPRCEYVSSGSDCGRIFIWKKRGGELFVLWKQKDVVNCIEPHPHTMALASSGIEYDIKIWTPKAIERAALPTNIGQVWLFHSVCIESNIIKNTLIAFDLMAWLDAVIYEIR
ncbi:hypothetical protein OIU84_015016 [Salix udensis]|uniref:Uncharacterized protein n=1 Tax=Salix udensis TaxID=889485 RepID=A0AAD6NS15_9ROSI|nr:hypothetical protein OIU84_015016 [Salix udensis]